MTRPSTERSRPEPGAEKASVGAAPVESQRALKLSALPADQALQEASRSRAAKLKPPNDEDAFLLAAMPEATESLVQESSEAAQQGRDVQTPTVQTEIRAPSPEGEWTILG